MSRRKLILLSFVILLILGCCDIFYPIREKFEVMVLSLSPFGHPVSGAWVEGGIDWESFKVQTDWRGVAVLPSFARGQTALIYINNFFPKRVQSLSPITYFIKPTPKQFRLIGDVKGWSIRFDAGILITVDYQGGYHVYSYNDQGIIETASAQLPKCIRETQLHGNTLWFSTHDDGIYVYSLENPFNPQQLFHLDIPGYLGSFALKDGIVIVSSPWEKIPLRVYTNDINGQCQEIAQFGNYFIVKMEFMNDHLVLLNHWDCIPVIFDLSDPANPYLVYDSGVDPEYWEGFSYGNYLVLNPRSQDEPAKSPINHKIIDLSDPANPFTAGIFPADSQLLKIIDGNTAIGKYYLWSGAISILKGDISQGFNTVAVITDNPFIQIFLHETEGYLSPYFIIGEQLWKLEDR